MDAMKRGERHAWGRYDELTAASCTPRASDVSTRDRGTLVAADLATKRALDIVLAGALLFVLVPVMAVIAIVIVLDDPGPVFFVCQRTGYRGRPLGLPKFRKMRQAPPGAPLTLADDPRFTRIGRTLAATKLDELPQLWSVLTGKMSLVGPRPEDPQFVALYPNEYSRILAVRPGLTGFSQLAFARESEILDHDDPVKQYVDQLLPQKVAIDLMYADRRNVWTDAKVLGWTAMAVLFRSPVAVHRETGRLGVRRRKAQGGQRGRH